MTPLEGHYRRLLSVYPPEHRAAYGPEMLSVLMSGSRPGQRFPGPADALDLLRAGVLARVDAGRRALRSGAWRDAAAVVALITALWMVAMAGAIIPFALRYSLPDGNFRETVGMEGAGLVMFPLRVGMWLAVVAAIMAGRRRAAAALGVAALLVEMVRFFIFLPIDAAIAMSDAWSPVIIVLCLGTLLAAIPGQTVGRTLGRRGTGLMVAGVTLGAAVFYGVLPHWLYGSTIGTQQYGLPEPLLISAIALMVAGAWSARPRVRRRVLVLLAPVLIVPFLHAIVWNVPIMPILADVITLGAILTVIPLGTLLGGGGPDEAARDGFGRPDRGDVRGS